MPWVIGAFLFGYDLIIVSLKMRLQVWIRVKDKINSTIWEKKFDNWSGPLPDRGHKIWYKEDEQPVTVEHIHWEFLEDYNSVMITGYNLDVVHR